MMRLCLLLVVACLGALGPFAEVARAADTADSKFSQQINLIDCTKTNVRAGAREYEDIRCGGAIMPTIDRITTSSSAPRIGGMFDVASMSEIRVLVGGQWYYADRGLHIDEAGRWWLDIPSQFSLSVGVYDVVVEVITKDGLLLRDGGDGELTIVAVDGETTGHFGGYWGCGYVAFGTVWCWPPFVLGVMIGVLISMGALGIFKRHKRKH